MGKSRQDEDALANCFGQSNAQIKQINRFGKAQYSETNERTKGLFGENNGRTRTDKQADRQTDRQSDRQTDRRTGWMDNNGQVTVDRDV